MTTNFTALNSTNLFGDSFNLKVRELNSVHEFEEFSRKYISKNGVSVDFLYLITSTKVVVFVDEYNEWQGGFVINAETSMRYLTPFEERFKRIILRDAQLKEEDLVEITCIWINSALNKKNPYARLAIYEKAINYAAETQKKYIIGGSVIFSVWKTFEIILPHTLYFGFVPFDKGSEFGKIVYNTPEDALQRLRIYLENQLVNEKKSEHANN